MAAENKSTVAYACQSCYKPMKTDTTLSGISLHELESTLLEMSIALDQDDNTEFGGEAEPEATISIEAPSSHPSLSSREKESGSSQYMSDLLFSMGSASSSVDHPLCEDCANLLLDRLDKELHQATAQRSSLSTFITNFKKASEDEQFRISKDKLEEQLTNLAAQREALASELEHRHREEEQLEAMIAEQEARLKELDASEQELWRVSNEHFVELAQFDEEQQSIQTQYDDAKSHLELLNKTNVYNDAFHIWFEGHFGTINGFRLGRLPTIPVAWSEINAAWGHTLLLLHVIARRLDITFERYTLLPNGSHSRIRAEDRQSKKLEYPLHGSDGFKMFWDAKYDHAMVAFLDCLCQLKDTLEGMDAQFKLPYMIDGDRIGDSQGLISIKLQDNSEEKWTQALKYLLTDMKWCLAWLCKQML